MDLRHKMNTEITASGVFQSSKLLNTNALKCYPAILVINVSLKAHFGHFSVAPEASEVDDLFSRLVRMGFPALFKLHCCLAGRESVLSSPRPSVKADEI